MLTFSTWINFFPNKSAKIKLEKDKFSETANFYYIFFDPYPKFFIKGPIPIQNFTFGLKFAAVVYLSKQNANF